jgi:two-component system, chemotaxis family, sensor kinase CheA
MCSAWRGLMSEFEAYRGLFVAESRENHENLVMNLLLLEKGSDQEAIDEIFRSVHTLKGASASMGFSQMERLCHAMEDVFSLVRSGAAAVSPELGNLLLACSDLIEQMLDDIESGGDSSSRNPDNQVHSLRQWIEQYGGTQKKAKESSVSPSLSGHPDESFLLTGAESCPEYEMCITVAGECLMKDVRAMLALGNLEALGTVLSVHPPREALDEGAFDGTLRIVIASDAGVDALKTAASGTEILNVEIRAAESQTVTTPANTIQDVTSLLHHACDTRELAEKIPEEVIPDGEIRAAEKQEIQAPDGSGEVKPAGDDKKQSSSADKTREIKNLRVDIHQLDHIMNLIEDLVINRGRLRQIAAQHKIKEMDEAIGMVDRSVSELHSLMMNIRMIPLTHIFNRLPRVVRDVAQHDGKEVEFVIDGGETELDRSVMDGLNDPLLHLIRNAVNHGIESPEVRIKAGKPQKGHIRLSARREQENVIIELTDDGSGINVGRVRAKAIEKGLITQEEAETFTTDQAIEMLFQPGFSTAEKISDISGRGVGLDVVKRSIEALNGTIRVETTPGKGSRFELLLPPTMAIVDVMIVRINKKRFGIPISSIVEVANFRRDATHRIGKGEAILLRDEVLQILRLDEMAGASQECEILVVVQYQKRKCCIPVDMVEGKQEVVVKPLSSFIGVTRGVSGVTILGDGAIIPVLDVNSMV